MRLQLTLTIQSRHEYRHNGLGEHKLRYLLVSKWFTIAWVAVIILVEDAAYVEPHCTQMLPQVRQQSRQHFVQLAEAVTVYATPVQALNNMHEQKEAVNLVEFVYAW